MQDTQPPQSEIIKNFIIENPTLSSKEVSDKFNVPFMVIAGYKAWHTRSINATLKQVIEEVKETPTEATKEKRKYVKRPKIEDKLMDKILETINTNVAPVKKVKIPFKNVNGYGKIKSRNKIANYVIDAKIGGIFISLPASEALLEKQIMMGLPNTRYLSAETYRPTFDKQKLTISEETLPITQYFGKISALIYGAKSDSYAGLLLDYCGELPSFMQEIEHALYNNITQIGGIVAMTFAKPIRGSNNFKFDLPINNLTNDKRSESDKIFESYFNQIVGRFRNYKLLEFFNYDDGTAMILVVLKRIY